jgi:hypothetical protein
LRSPAHLGHPDPTSSAAPRAQFSRDVRANSRRSPPGEMLAPCYRAACSRRCAGSHGPRSRSLGVSWPFPIPAYSTARRPIRPAVRFAAAGALGISKTMGRTAVGVITRSSSCSSLANLVRQGFVRGRGSSRASADDRLRGRFPSWRRGPPPRWLIRNACRVRGNVTASGVRVTRAG